jgi:uncharacterized membrane protein
MSMRAMFDSHPQTSTSSYSEPIVQCVVFCYACAEACTVCADASLAEPDVEELRQCIRRSLDCADLCSTVATIASRRTGDNQSVIRAMLECCAIACRVCAEECEDHAEIHDHCRICADACRDCEEACRGAMSTVH